MPKLYVFGCSYSAAYEHKNIGGPSIKEYYDFRGGNFPITWSELLANDLNLELVNTAKWGADNYEIFEKFCKKSAEFEENDIVLIGWTDVNRFRLYNQKYKSLRSVNIWTTSLNDYENISQQTINEIIVNRSNELWIDEIRSWMLIINELSKKTKFIVYHWSFFNDMMEFNILNVLLESGAEFITEETNGLINNAHMGEKGHIRQFEYFKNLITNRTLKKLI